MKNNSPENTEIIEAAGWRIRVLLPVLACMLFMLHPVPAFSLCGDINGDGVVSQDDVIALMQSMSGGAALESGQQAKADGVVSGLNEKPNGKLLSNDIFIMTRASAEELVLGCDEGGINISGEIAAPTGVALGESAGGAKGLKLKKGVVVSVYRVNDNGEKTGQLLQRAVTDNNGKYTLTLSPGEEPGGGLLIVTGDGDNVMRALITGEKADLDPAAEFVTTKIFQSGRALSGFSAAELDDLYARARDTLDNNSINNMGTVVAAVAALSAQDGAPGIVALVSSAGAGPGECFSQCCSNEMCGGNRVCASGACVLPDAPPADETDSVDEADDSDTDVDTDNNEDNDTEIDNDDNDDAETGEDTGADTDTDTDTDVDTDVDNDTDTDVDTDVDTDTDTDTDVDNDTDTTTEPEPEPEPEPVINTAPVIVACSIAGPVVTAGEDSAASIECEIHDDENNLARVTVNLMSLGSERVEMAGVGEVWTLSGIQAAPGVERGVYPLKITAEDEGGETGDAVVNIAVDSPSGALKTVTVEDDELGTVNVLPGELVVSVAPGGDAGGIALLAAGSGGVITESAHGLLLARFPQGADMAVAKAALLSSPDVLGISPNAVFGLSGLTPDDPPFAAAAPASGRWGYEIISAPDAWERAENNGRPVIAVIDSGVDAILGDLAGRVAAGRNFIGGLSTDDDNGHGTHIAGIAAAKGNNGAGMAGVCWDCGIMPLKVCDSAGSCPFFSVLAAVAYAAENGADIINISIAGNAAPGTSVRNLFQAVVDYATGKNALVVAAAGNQSGDAGNVVPASLDGVLAVGASDDADGLAGFSNYGGIVDIAAPGKNIMVLSPGGAAGSMSGTSAAAAFVSGAAGMLLSHAPSLTAVAVEQALVNGADAVSFTPAIGGGRLNIFNSLKPFLSNDPPEIISVTVSPQNPSPGETVTLAVSASDPDFDTLEYQWSVPSGALSAGDSSSALWTLPADCGVFAAEVTVSDGEGSSVSGSVSVSIGQDGFVLINVNPVQVDIDQGETTHLTAYGQFANFHTCGIQPDWTITPDLGIITPGGDFTGLTPGTAEVTATIGALTAKSEITVHEVTPPEDMVIAGTCTVMNNNDSGAGSLRTCMTQANTNIGADTIDFDVSMVTKTIKLLSDLPQITDSNTTIINTTGGEIILNGNNKVYNCLRFSSANNVVRGMTIISCRDGIALDGAGATNNTIAGNVLGINDAGTDLPNINAIDIKNGAGNNTIGGTVANDRNVIIGTNCVLLDAAGSNMIYGNYIGINQAGTAKGVCTNGVFLQNTTDTLVGGNGAGQRNVIGGCTYAGVNVQSDSHRTVIRGNYIGSDVTGMNKIPLLAGILIYNSDDVVVGGSTAADRNVIVGSSARGMEVGNSSGAIIRGNYIGVASDGVTPLGNGNDGILIDVNGLNTVIGGTGAGDPNLIAYNKGVGIYAKKPTTQKNKFTRNRVFGNGDGASRDIDVRGTVNASIRPPVLTVTPNGGNIDLNGTIICTAYPCIVEMFKVDDVPSGINANNIGEGGGFEYVSSLTVNAGNTFVFPNIVPNANYTKLTTTLTDNNGNTSMFSVNVKTDINDPPVVESCDFDPDPLVADGSSTTMECKVSDLDAPADGDLATVKVNLSALGLGAAVALTYRAADDVWFLVITPSSPSLPGLIDTHTLKVTATDKQAATGELDVDLEVKGAPPVISNCTFTPGSIIADGVETTTLECDVSDLNNDIDSVTVNLSALGMGVAEPLVDVGGGKGELTGITAALVTVIKTHNFTVTITDQEGLTDTDTASLDVTGIPPDVSNCVFSPASIKADGVETTTLTCDASDPNGDLDTVTVDLTALGLTATEALTDAGGGVWRKINIKAPGNTVIQIHNITITATDDTAATDTDTTDLEVTGAPPVITICSFNPNTIPTDGVTETILQCTITDPNGVLDIDTVTVDLTGLGDGVQPLVWTGGNIFQRSAIVADPSIAFITYTPTVTVTDKAGKTDTDNPSITATNAPPVVSGCAYNPTDLPENGYSTTVLECTVIDPNGLADILSVKVNLSALGMGAAESLTHIGGNIWQLTNITAIPSTPAGVTYPTKVTAKDQALDIGEATPGINVVEVPPGIDSCDFVPDTIPADGATVTKLTCNVIEPTNAVLTVTVDLTPLGGLAAAGLSQVVAGKWELDLIVAAGSTELKTHNLTVEVTDQANEKDTGVALITVTGVPPVVSNCAFTPNSIPADGTTTTKLECDVTDPNNDLDTVTVDLTDLGLTNAESLNDANGDDVWELDNITAPGTTAIQVYTFTVTATDDTAATGDSTATLDVSGTAPDVTNCEFIPNSVQADGATITKLKCDVTDSNNNIDTVTADLTALGLTAAEALTDAGGGVWEKDNITVPAATLVNTYTITITATDLTALSNTSDAALTVTGIPPDISNCAFTPNFVGNDGITKTTLSCDLADPGGILDTLLVDLTAIGLTAAEALTDANQDNVWERADITVDLAINPNLYTFTVIATDLYGGTDTENPSLAVINAPPVFSACSFNPIFLPADGVSTTTLRCSIDDPNSDAFTVTADLSVLNLGIVTLIDVGGGVYEYTGITAQPGVTPGVESIAVTATDNSDALSFSTGVGILLLDIKPESLCSAGNKLVPHIVAPTPPGELFYPQEVAVDGSGNIFITNLSNNRIEKYDSECNFLKTWGSTGAGEDQFNQPKGIVYNEADGLLYISDRYDYVRKFDTEGNFVSRWRGSSGIVSIDIDSSGNVYAASTALGGKVYIYDTDGIELDSWRAVSIPTGIAVSDTGEIFVVDSANNTVRKYDTQGNHLADIGSMGTADGKLMVPQGVEVSGSFLYVANKNNNRIEIFSTDGSFIFAFGEDGREDGALYRPSHMVKTPDGDLIILEQSNDRVQVFTGIP